jgi:hypothetical protein
VDEEYLAEEALTMKKTFAFVGALVFAATLFGQQGQPAAGAPGGRGGGGRGAFGAALPPLVEAGFTKIFDGTMSGWDCDPNFWKSVDGVMVGETTVEHQPAQNIFCIWKGGQPADFELKLEYRMTGAQTANSGVQYRSVEMPEVAKWVLKGYQADIDMQQTFTGQLYEERGRGFLSTRGQVTYVPTGGKPGAIGTTGDADQLKGYLKLYDWNEIHIIARGSTLIQMINGHVTSLVIDDDAANRKASGVIGIQLHKTPAAMKMEARNIRLKTF